ncbi:multiubiquitin domain-containing protein [Flavobacterium oreochromis]|uniref:multiubiquitin domain-containing protein n=1 Tax=Flavobacterium oreochromis TaxID=2906078 RepID=UPI00385988A4
MEHIDKNAGKPVLKLTVNKKSYDWFDQYITTEQIRVLGEIKKDDRVYLSVKEPWLDELILPATKVNLARPGIEEFYSTKKLVFTVNGKSFQWPDQFITGMQIREVAGIDSDDEIYLNNKKPYIDRLINNEDEVDLARPTVEHFYTVPVNFEVTIIVSGQPKKWTKPKISFEEVIILAYGTYSNSPTMVYTVAYEDGPKQNPEGSMIKDTVVFVKNKMIFHATATDKS